MRVIIRTILEHTDLEPDRPEPETPRVRGISTVPSRGARVVVRRHRVPDAAPTAVEAPA